MEPKSTEPRTKIHCQKCWGEVSTDPPGTLYLQSLDQCLRDGVVELQWFCLLLVGIVEDDALPGARIKEPMACARKAYYNFDFALPAAAYYFGCIERHEGHCTLRLVVACEQTLRVTVLQDSMRKVLGSIANVFVEVPTAVLDGDYRRRDVLRWINQRVDSIQNQKGYDDTWWEDRTVFGCRAMSRVFEMQQGIRQYLYTPPATPPQEPTVNQLCANDAFLDDCQESTPVQDLDDGQLFYYDLQGTRSRPPAKPSPKHFLDEESNSDDESIKQVLGSIDVDSLPFSPPAPQMVEHASPIWVVTQPAPRDGDRGQSRRVAGDWSPSASPCVVAQGVRAVKPDAFYADLSLQREAAETTGLAVGAQQQQRNDAPQDQAAGCRDFAAPLDKLATGETACSDILLRDGDGDDDESSPGSSPFSNASLLESWSWAAATTAATAASSSFSTSQGHRQG